MTESCYYDPSYGVVSSEHGWYPAPRYLLRRHRVLKLLGSVSPGNLLEIGCGAGALLEDMRRLGFNCTALETSESAYRIASELHAANDTVAVYNSPQESWVGGFDYVLAFEVLEHIEHDADALKLWASWLKPGGCLMLSVPCHMDKWNITDEWAGHFRRYEKDDLKALLEACDLSLAHFESYGFPLANLIQPLHASSIDRMQKEKESGIGDKSSQTASSGVERSVVSPFWRILSSVPGKIAMYLFKKVQSVFMKLDVGNGYIVIAKVP